MLKRKLLKAFTSLFLVLALILPIFSVQAVVLDSSYMFYMVPNSHIDTAYKWPYQHTAEIVMNDTYGRAISALKLNLNYRFSTSASKHYEFLNEYYKDKYWDDLVSLIESGQWEITGGQVVEPDLNMPSGEALVRQSLYAQHYFENTFGKEYQPKVAFLPDTFGYAGNFPQIIKKSEMDYFVTAKLNQNDTNVPRDSDALWWRAIDGESDVLTYLLASGYSSTTWSAANVLTAFNNNDKPGFETGLKIAMGFYGSGDHGGGPTATGSNNSYTYPGSLNTNASYPSSVRMSNCMEFFTALEDAADNGANIRIHEGEMYFENHRGTYTSWSRVKKNNRYTEMLAETAEKAATLSFWTGAVPNNSEPQITAAWDKILLSQMHDVLPGSSCPYQYYITFNQYELVKNLLSNVQRNALLGMAYRADTNVSGIPVFVYNPSSWTRSNQVTVDIKFNEMPTHVKVMDGNTELPITVLSKNSRNNTVKIGFLAKDVPAIGYKVFNAVASEVPSVFASDLTFNSDNWVLENSYLRMTLNPETGYIKSLISKSDGQEVEVFAQNSGTEANELHVYVDTGGRDYPAWNLLEPEINKEPTYILDEKPVIMKVTENTKERVTIQVTKLWQNSTITQYITMYSDNPQVEVHVALDWNEAQRLLKVSFPILSDAENATYEIAYGALERPTTRDSLVDRARFEVSGHKWMDITDKAGTYGVSLLNDAKYGYDSLKKTVGNETFVRARLSLVRSPRSSDIEYEHDKYEPGPYYMQEGYQEFNYSIYPHKGSWKDADTTNQAYELNYPMTAFQATKNNGGMGSEYTFISSDKNNVIISAVKNQFDDPNDKDTLIIRLYESIGRDTNDVTLTLPSYVLSANEVNMLEHEYYGKKEIDRDGNKISFNIKKYEILTIEVKIKPFEGDPIELTQSIVDLSDYFNIVGASDDDNRRAGNFDGFGNSAPIRNWPETIDYQGIKFSLAEAKVDKNFVSAMGQEIPLPKGNYERVYLVGAAAGRRDSAFGDLKITYTDETNDYKGVKFANWRTDLSGWDRFEKKDVKPYVYDTIAHVFTHYHNGVADEMTLENYLFIYAMDVDVSKTLSSITLPNSPEIKIAAISVAKSPIPNYANVYENMGSSDYGITYRGFTLDGEDADNLNAGEISFKADFGTDYDSKDVTLIVAAYKDGKLIDLNSKSEKLSMNRIGQQITVETPTITIPPGGDMLSYTVKGFIWESDTMIPLIEATIMGEFLRPKAPNIALLKPAFSSGNENTTNNASRAVDGDTTTRWASNYVDGAYWYVDLQDTYSVSKIEILWQTSYAYVISIWVSEAAENWTHNSANWVEVFRTEDGLGGFQKISFDPVQARYVKIIGERRAQQWGTSFFEFRVFEY